MIKMLSHIREEKMSYSLNYVRVTKETYSKKKVGFIVHIYTRVISSCEHINVKNLKQTRLKKTKKILL